MKTKAIFFDRDDTLIHDKHYMHKLEDLNFLDETFDVLKTAQKLGYKIFIVTNQSGIGRGYFQEEDMHRFHDHMLSKLKEEGIEIEEIAYCPHAPEANCECRKPGPKLIIDLCEKFDIDKNLSFMVGDRDSDINAGISAGVKTIKIEPGHLSPVLDQL